VSLKKGHVLFTVIFLLICTHAAAACDESRAIFKVGDAIVKAEVANTPTLHQKGLMFRKKLGANQGMWFVMGHASTASFWMKNTYVPLDLLFVGYNMVVLHIHEDARPMDETLISSPIPYWFVLEVPAGFARKHGVKPGDTIENRTPKC